MAQSRLVMSEAAVLPAPSAGLHDADNHIEQLTLLV